MKHPEVGDNIQFAPMYEDKYISGTIEWVGSSQFAVRADDEPAHREIILFSEDRWKSTKKGKTVSSKDIVEEDTMEDEE